MITLTPYAFQPWTRIRLRVMRDTEIEVQAITLPFPIPTTTAAGIGLVPGFSVRETGDGASRDLKCLGRFRNDALEMYGLRCGV